MPNPVVPHSAFAHLTYVVQYAGGRTHNATDVVLQKLTTLLSSISTNGHTAERDNFGLGNTHAKHEFGFELNVTPAMPTLLALHFPEMGRAEESHP